MLPKYDPNDRCAEFTEDVDNYVTQVALEFAIPVHISREHYDMLRTVMEGIVEAPYNQPKEGIHWPGGEGSRPIWSAQDAAFLGKAGKGDPNIPDGAEPTFDDSCLLFESMAREFISEEERAKKLRRREKKARGGWEDVPGPCRGCGKETVEGRCINQDHGDMKYRCKSCGKTYIYEGSDA